MEGRSANNHLAVRNAAKNHDNAATNWGSYDKSQDRTNQIQEDRNERAIYQHELTNLLNTFQAIAPTGRAGLQATNTMNVPKNARTSLPSRPSGASQSPAGQFNKVYQMLEITLSKAETHKVNNKEQNP